MILINEIKNRISYKISKRVHNNIGGAEIVSIVLIIIVVIGFAALFKTELTNLLKSWFSTITTESNKVV